MREAAFPNFKKLYGVLSRAQGPFTEGLPAGNYNISINYSILYLRMEALGGFGDGTLLRSKLARSFNKSFCITGVTTIF